MLKNNEKSKKYELIVAIIGVLIISSAFYLKAPPITITEAPPITITEASIKEVNFTGTKSVIAGTGVLADEATRFINNAVATFKQDADIEVPMASEEYPDWPSYAKYEIRLKAVYLKNAKTSSIVIDQYVHTGGANGYNSYKVFTVSNATGKILHLRDIIPVRHSAFFTAYVKQSLIDWGADPEDVSDLTFDSFSNWSLDGNNLTIYFDEYEIGPGALGAVPFELPLLKFTG